MAKQKHGSPQSSSLSFYDKQGHDNDMLLGLQRETFQYFLDEAHPRTGLVSDSTQKKSPASIAATAMALNCYIVAAARGLITRTEARRYTLRTLRFFKSGKQGKGKNTIGYKGFFYHFLSPSTGHRAWKSEVSTIDTALLCAAMLTSAQFFRLDHPEEKEIRSIAEFLYRRIDWKWALNGKNTLSHGWTPENGFLPDHWSRTYNEAQILYVLALGSPTFPIPERCYQTFTKGFRLKTTYGIKHLPAGPLFIHQLSQVWLKLKGLEDAFNRHAGFDYFENSRRATHAQRLYAIKNPKHFKLYGKSVWGLSASDGPGPTEVMRGKRKIKFFGYEARGAPHDLDDGTLCPSVVVASLPFAPEIVLESTRHSIERFGLKNKRRKYGLDACYNPTFDPNTKNPVGWISPHKFGLNQGPIILMIENYLTGMIWNLTTDCDFIMMGLKRAGFRR